MENLAEIKESLPHSWPTDEVFPQALVKMLDRYDLGGRTILQTLALPVGAS